MKFYGGPFQGVLYNFPETEITFLFGKNSALFPYIPSGIRKLVVFVCQWECSKSSIFHTKGINSEIQLIWQRPKPKSLCIGRPQNNLVGTAIDVHGCVKKWAVAGEVKSCHAILPLLFSQKHLLQSFRSLFISAASWVCLPLPGLPRSHPSWDPQLLQHFFPSWQPHVFPASHSSFPLRDPNLRMNAFPFPTFGKQRNEFPMVIPGLSLGGLPHFLKRGGWDVIVI